MPRFTFVNRGILLSPIEAGTRQRFSQGADVADVTDIATRLDGNVERFGFPHETDLQFRLGDLRHFRNRCLNRHGSHDLREWLATEALQVPTLVATRKRASLAELGEKLAVDAENEVLLFHDLSPEAKVSHLWPTVNSSVYSIA